MFQDFLANLDVLRLRTARFRRVALHVHSPDSHDWGTGGSRELNARPLFEGSEGLTRYANAMSDHLDFVCVTDHMRCGFSTALCGLHDGSSGFRILPGMEVNIKIEPLDFVRIHVLAILPEGSTPEAFACLFAAQSEIPKDDARRTGHEEVVGLTLAEWVAKVQKENGICIAAHVNTKNGLRLAFRQAAQNVIELFPKDDPASSELASEVPEVLKDFIFDSGINAIEIHKSHDGKHYRWISKKDGQPKSLATVLAFDAHCCEAFNRPEKVTHIKMTSLGIDGLRNALQFSDTRIRFPQTLPSTTHPRLLGISIKGEHDSFFSDVTIALAENLNCLIGVRGSGKSTIVEALRYVFGYNRTLDDLGDSMAKSIREMQRANLKGSIIRVAYRIASGEDRILQATFDEKDDYTTKCFTIDGESLDVADVETCGDYPLRLFGWSEIETLGRSPARQRELLDRLVVELGPVFQRRSQAHRALVSNRGDITRCVTDLQTTFEQHDRHIVRFREYTADFGKLNTEEVRGLFSSLDLAKAKLRLLNAIAANVNEQMAHFEELSSVSLRERVDEIISTSGDELRQWWLTAELGALGIIAVEADVSALARQAFERLSAFRTLLIARIDALQATTEEIEQGLQTSFDKSGDDSMQRIADLRNNAERRLNAVAETRRVYLGHWERLRLLLSSRTEMSEELTHIQNEIAGIRAKHNRDIEETLNRFLPENRMKVSIDFRAGEDKRDYTTAIVEVIPGRSNNPIVARLRQAATDLLNPVTCANMILESEYSSLVGKPTSLNDDDVALNADDIDKWESLCKPFEADEHADVPVLAEAGRKLDVILALHETKWDDFEMILLDGGPVNEKSPGQRASAMLPLIALAEKSPLVIDQPEDNLDKRLIGEVLMQVLAELKEKRQITVCTHDPNIVVGGDAEQVVVLKAEGSRRGMVEAHGSIDNEKIINTVVDLLEGGAAAFAARGRRYGLVGENAGQD